MKDCKLECDNGLEAGSDGYCDVCRVYLRRKSAEDPTLLHAFHAKTMLRVRRLLEIRGENGKGPAAGSYVAILQVKREARAREIRRRERENARNRMSSRRN